MELQLKYIICLVNREFTELIFFSRKQCFQRTTCPSHLNILKTMVFFRMFGDNKLF